MTARRGFTKSKVADLGAIEREAGKLAAAAAAFLPCTRAAELLGVHRQTIRRMIRAGLLEPVTRRNGTTPMVVGVTVESLRKFIESRAATGKEA